MKKIKEYWFIPLYLAIALALYIMRPLTGDEIVAFPWATVSYIFMLLIVEEGIRKENIALPIFRLLNSIRSTSFLFFVLLSSTFILSLLMFDFMVVLIMVPFTIKLLRESNKEKYTALSTALITLLGTITSLFTPFSTGNLYLFLNRETPYSSYMSSLLPAFFISFAVFVIEAFITLRKTKGDEIYLHIEDEDYWEKERKGIRVLYVAFFLVLLFGRRFNTIDLLLVVALAFIILDRKVYRKVNYPVFITYFLITLSSYILGKIIEPSKGAELVTSVLFTRLGSEIAFGTITTSLPSTVLSFSFAFIYAIREMKEKKKEFVKDYALLALPLLAVYIIFFLLA